MSRRRRLRKTMRSPQRAARTWRSRRSRQLCRALRRHFANDNTQREEKP